MKSKGKHSQKYSGQRIFLKTVILTASALLLIVIGYYSAGYFSGGL